MRVRIRCEDKNLRAKIRRAVLRHKLDRRKVYELGLDGELATQARCVVQCSGCTETSDGYNVNGHPIDPKHRCLIGGGCDECGYTGKRITFFPDPVEVGGKFIRIAPSKTLPPEMFLGESPAESEPQP